jgi:hypothetical protein
MLLEPQAMIAFPQKTGCHGLGRRPRRAFATLPAKGTACRSFLTQTPASCGRRAKPWHLAVIAAATAAAGASAQSREVPAPPQDHPIVVTGAVVHTVTGPTFAAGYVAFNDGRIIDIGDGEPPTLPWAEIVDAQGLHVYPGLISCDTTLGLIETGSISVTRDYSETGDVTPEVRAAVAINPDSDLIPVTRANGILTAMVTPRGGLVSGRSSLIRLDGWTWEQMAIESDAGLVISWPRTEPDLRKWWWRETKPEKEQRKEIGERLEAIERLFDDAIAYHRSADADPKQASDLRHEAMRDVIGGLKPVFVRASSRGQIESAVAWAGRRNLDIVIVGGREADAAAELLRTHDVPVIVTGLHRLPQRRDDPYDTPFRLRDRVGARTASEPQRRHGGRLRAAPRRSAERGHDPGGGDPGARRVARLPGGRQGSYADRHHRRSAGDHDRNAARLH